MLGILLIDKPLGCTSHDVVNRLRRILHTKRVGHAGTLDPLATGLLVVAIGPATRFLQYLPLEPKEYVAEIEFGKATTTFDREGEVTSSGAVPEDLGHAFEVAKQSLLGLIDQLPPMYSAVKIDGKPLYRYARAGEEVAREPRRVHIGALEVLKIEGSTVTTRIECSGGTYVRTLAHDLGEKIGCGAHLAGLRRTRVGRFDLHQSSPLEEIGPDRLLPLEEALVPMPMLICSDLQIQHVREGRPIGTVDQIPSGKVALVEPGFGVFSIARVNGNLLQPECVIPSEVVRGNL